MTTTTMPQHPKFCDTDQCISPEMPGDIRLHSLTLGNIDGDGQGLRVELIQIDDNTPKLYVAGAVDLTIAELDEAISALTAARERLAQVL